MSIFRAMAAFFFFFSGVAAAADFSEAEQKEYQQFAAEVMFQSGNTALIIAEIKKGASSEAELYKTLKEARVESRRLGDFVKAELLINDFVAQQCQFSGAQDCGEFVAGSWDIYMELVDSQFRVEIPVHVQSVEVNAFFF